MPTLSRLDVWTDYQCAGGTRESVLPLLDCLALSGTERVTREDALRVTVPKAAPAASALALGRVLRLVYKDGSFDEWRIHEMVDQSGRDGGRYQVLCRSVLYELRDLALIASTSGGVMLTAVSYDGKTATDVVDSLLASLPSWWARGTISPTIAVSFAASDATPLKVLRDLVSALRASGASAELTVTRNGTTGYLIEIPATIGSSAAVADVRTAKNILTSDRTRSREPLATRVYPRGSDGCSIEYAYWRVTNISGSDIEVRQAETSAAVLAFDDQLNGLYLENDAGTRTLISDSVASTSTVTVASTAGFAVNKWCRLVTDSSGTGMVRLDYPLATSHKVLVVEDGADVTTNIVANPFMSRWPGSTSAPPVNWSNGGAGGATYTRNSTATFIRRGSYSLRCQTTTTGQFVRTDTQSLLPGRGSTYCVQLDIYRVTSGGVTILLRNQSGASITSTTLPTSTNAWHTIQFTGVNVSPATGLYIEVQNSAGGAVEFYVDSAQITPGAAQAAWTLGSGPANVYRRALAYLEENAVEPTTYTLTVADLHRWSPDEWPDDALVLGGAVRITDAELGITVTSRITEITRDYRVPTQTSLVLERTTRTLTSVLAPST